jgi:hypothetical protein
MKQLLTFPVLSGLLLTSCAGAPASDLEAMVQTMVEATLTAHPAPSVAGVDSIGVWKQDAVGGRYLQLNENGTYRVASERVWLEQAPREIGRFRLEGTLLTFTASDESSYCKGQSGSYEVELTQEGQLQFVLQEDVCQKRAYGHEGAWSRVEP